jgi:hypothetical protein
MVMLVSRPVVMLVPPMPVVTVFGSGTHRKSSYILRIIPWGGI